MKERAKRRKRIGRESVREENRDREKLIGKKKKVEGEKKSKERIKRWDNNK